MYRLHSAIQDARCKEKIISYSLILIYIFRALCDVFRELHEAKEDWESNTSLVLTDTLRHGFQFEVSEKLSLSYLVFEQDSKYLKQLSHLLNPEPNLVQIVETIRDWPDLIKTHRLFDKVLPPRCFMFG